MVPVDHVLLSKARALPALVVVRLPQGDTHFVVLWRRHGHWVQVMDPATGRRWRRVTHVMHDLYVHTLPVPAEAWREWANTASFLAPLGERLEYLGVSPKAGEQLIREALASAHWLPLARLDAAVRMVDALVQASGLRRGGQAQAALMALLERAAAAPTANPVIPDPYWSVRPAPQGPEGEDQVRLRGAVLIHVAGPQSVLPEEDGEAETTPPELTPELAAALDEPPSRPFRTLWQMLRQDGLLTPVLLTMALALGAGGVLMEALLFRSLIDLSRDLNLPWQRLGAMGLILALIVLLLILDLAVAVGVLRGGRRLEVRFRSAFLAKLPRLGDRYLHSRPLSDMAGRSHSVYRIRQLLGLGGQGLQLIFELMMTAAAMIWLAPASAPWVILAILLALGIPLMVQPTLAERDLRVRTHHSALSRFDFDALRGLVAIRTHGADRALEREHCRLLGDWIQASWALYRVAVTVEGLQFLTGFGLAVVLLGQELLHSESEGRASALLLVYWALSLPVTGQNSAHVKLLPTRQGVAVRFDDLQVRLAGHVVLDRVDLDIAAGQHLAIVGASGAGKSSLVGTLLGWHRPAAGAVSVDGQVLDGPTLDQLRRHTAWVAPAVHLWNRTLFDNLHYGTAQPPACSLPEVIAQAELRQVLETLPDGLQSLLGEGGGRLSGGEGQRVRFGRALLRPETRLVILDEPFRGLDRERRRELLRRARQAWAGATLLCITHDVGETQDFERVAVMDHGMVVEDGTPADLLARSDSRYRALIQAETAVRATMWSGPRWRYLHLQHGQLHEPKLDPFLILPRRPETPARVGPDDCPISVAMTNGAGREGEHV